MAGNLRNKNKKRGDKGHTENLDEKSHSQENKTDSGVKLRDEKSCAEYAGSKVICGPKLSPLNDTDDFILLRCDADCFHLVLPFLSIHLSLREMTLARIALQNLFQNRFDEKSRQKENVLFQAYRCPDGHCHLICQGTINLCLTEEVAAQLERELTVQGSWIAEPKKSSPYLT